MNKTVIFGLSILSVFLLCSLSYNPIIAEKPIEKLTHQVIEYREYKNDCGCNDETFRWEFPIFCSILGLFLLIFMILVISMNQNQFLVLLEFVMSIGNSFNCW